jgi:DNA-binding response OmpR family regulator
MFLPRAAAGIVNPSADMSDWSGSGEPKHFQTILMVEDDDLVRDHIESELLALGYRVLVAHDGNEAEGILESDDKIDLLLTDVVMPGGLSGKQLAERATALRPSLPILFTSGYIENLESIDALLGDGANFLKKPFRRRELATKVRTTLRLASSG